MAVIARQKCGKCKKVKPRSDFGIDNHAKSGRANTCKSCRKSYVASEPYKADRKTYYARLSKDKKKYYRRNQRTNNLERIFGITHEEYERIHKEQNGLCAICGKSEIIDDKHLAVDHDHKTGKIRALLCTRCNLAVGRLEANMEYTNRLLGYIKKGGI